MDSPARAVHNKPPADTTKPVSPLVIKYKQTFDARCPLFTGGQNAQKIWPKFRPQSSLNRRIFENRHFIGKQKQTCQGSMIVLPPHQTWRGWVPPTPRTVGAFGTPKCKSGKFLIYPPFLQPTPSRRPPILHQQWGSRLSS